MKQLKSFLASSIKAPALIGILMIVPTTFFLISVFLKYGLGNGFLFDPLDSFYSNKIVGALIFFAPLGALIINLIYVLGVKTLAGEGSIKFDFEIKLRALNLGVSLICLFYTALMFSYLISENLGHYYRGQM